MSEPVLGETGQVYRAIMTQEEIHQALAAWVLNKRAIAWNGSVNVQTITAQRQDDKVLQTRVEVQLVNPAQPLYK